MEKTADRLKARDEAIIPLLEKGMSHAEIGRQLGIPRGTISTHCWKRGLKSQWHHPSEWSRADMDRLEKLWCHSDAHREAIGKMLGRDKDCVAAKAAQLGMRRPVPHWSEDDERLLRKMYCADDEDVQDIADYFKRSVSAIRGKLYRLQAKRDDDDE